MNSASASRSPSETPIHLSASAIAEVRRLQSVQTSQEDTCIRLSLLAGGCETFLYDLHFDTQRHPEDQSYTLNGLTFVVQPEVLTKIEGLQIDYAEDLMGGGFRFHNPNAAKSCGCGNSFSLN